jgi:superfamily II DNA or RNA helicase
MAIELRDYQQDLYDKTRLAMARGNKRVLVTVGCGGGKSYIFAKMAEQAKGSVLVLTHRQELKEQTGKLFADNGINARIEMILTEANRLGQYERPALIITDEAHLSRSNSWMKVLDYYNTYTVGFTATPVRLDGKPLGDIYDELVTGVSVKWLIDNKRLAPYEYYAPTAVETDGLRVQMGDYVIKDIEQLMNERAIYGNVIESYRRFAPGERTIAYCVSVRHARNIAENFNSAGIRAEVLFSGTPTGERRRIMEAFRAGKFSVLCNVGIISEGVSIDEVTCCLLLRPTESHALYWQQGMRAMRYQPGKVAKIIDCVGNYTRNPLFDADVEWSLTQSVRKQPRINSEGDFHIRTCEKCYKVFKTAPVCPYCGTVYSLKPREIKAHEDIELARITAEEAERVERERKKARMEQGRAQTFEELLAIGRAKGYKNPAYWAQQVMRGRKRN